MAKAPAPASTPPARKKGPFLILLALFGAGAAASGVAVPFLLPHGGSGAEPAAGAKPKHSANRAYIPFGDVVVNLNEERLTRYLRVKLLLVVDAEQEKEATELVTKNKPLLKNWLIGYLSDKSLQDISGAAGVNKMRREVWREFNAELYPDGSERIVDIFLEEFVVQ
jgi:flagellar basal body-associated protein FliL